TPEERAMSFLAPVFLAGLAALAIPIVIHLTHKERREPVIFPSLMFLRTIPFRTERRQRIRNLSLFLLRTAAVILVVAAFARPLLPGAKNVSAGLGRAREVVVLVDRSYSMGYGDHWQRALAAAGSAVDGLGPDDRATLVFFDEQAEAVVAASSDKAQLHAALNAAVVSWGATRYPPALSLARDLVTQSDKPVKNVFLISDFQRNGWDAHGDVRFPPGATLTPVDVSGTKPENLAVTGVLLDRASESGRIGVTARIAGRSHDAVTTAQVVLEIDGKEMRSASVSVPDGGVGVAQFAPVPVPGRMALGRVRLARSDQLSADDAFQFLVTPPATVNVLLVESGTGPNDGLYVRRALGVGRDPGYHVMVQGATALAAHDFPGKQLVIVDDAALSGSGAQAVSAFAKAGGGVLLVLGPKTLGTSFQRTFPDLIAREGSAAVDRLSDRGGVVSVVDYHHPALAAFQSPRSGDFSAGRFFRYRRVDVTPAATVLMRYDDGATALAELPADSGVVMVWTSDVSNTWNDLPLKPVFLPFLHQIVRYLARYVEAPPWRTVGAALDLKDLPAARRADGTAAAEVVVESPSGRRSSRHPGQADGHLRLDEAGFYRVRPLDTGREATVLAVNPDVSESDLSHVEPDAIVGAVVTNGTPAAERNAPQVTGPEQMERQQGLWWYLLGAALLLLAAETLVARRTEPIVRLSAREAT
ncbi:MAG TPA: BatA and WFA domain-containing protein, partial [Gemmatimonadales bacterium]